MTPFAWLRRALKSLSWEAILAAVALLVIVILLFVVHAKNEALADLRADNSVLRANVTALQTAAKAADQAAIERAADTAQVDQMQKGLLDAIKDIEPGKAPGPASIALGCQRLRDAGARDAALPAVCRSAGGK